jgi:hypothetical protein
MANRVVISWDQFEGGGDLATVANRIEQLPKTQLEGTTLIIRDLREAWTEAAIKRVYRFVSELIQPFPLYTAKNTEPPDHGASTADEGPVDPGFRVSLRRELDSEISVVADEMISILAHALAEIDGYVDREGYGYWSLESKRYNIDDADLPIGRRRDADHEPFEVLRNVSLKAYYFIHRDPELIPRAMLGTIRSVAREKGGVRVYRNGFRVMPYGEHEDDWLGLDESTSRRAILPPHANNNFFGFVEIVDPEGAQFEETSSREGLLENRAFEELQD